MRKVLAIILTAMLPVAAGGQVMRYDREAAGFNEALPLGNGHIGAMVYGGVADDLVNLNEATLWGGSGADNNPQPDGPDLLRQVREALFAEDWEGARKLLVPLQGPNASAFLPMGDLHIRQTFPAAGALRMRRQLPGAESGPAPVD